ncbi:MAG: LPXTG cell wall anchor domain-containing protein, partial [Clostridiaceae bacterium]|nr:LPXTG cell wall anchor domain-containing protein [Clostridiaceae bacterium]
QTANPVITKPKAGDTSVSGTAEPGAKVVVELPDGTTKETTADADGNWKVVFAKPLAEGDTVGATATKQGKDPSNKVITTVGSAQLGQTTNPRITKPKAGDTSVSGTAEPGAKVVVELSDGTTKETTADADGNWKVVFAKPLEEGQEVGATATKDGKDPSNKVITTVGPAPEAEQTANPTINKPVAGDTSVSGTAEPGAKVVVTLPDGTTKETTADADGNWKVSIDKPLEEGDTVGVTATTADKDPSDKVTITVGPKDPIQTVDPTQPQQKDPTQPEATDPLQTQPTEPSAPDKVIPVGSDIDSPIPENYIRMYFDPMDVGWLQYNPTFDTGITIAFDVLKDITWSDALTNGLMVPTATHVDPAYTFDKWSLAMSGGTVINNTTHRYYYFTASYKPVEPVAKVTTTPTVTTTPAGTATPAKDGISPVVRTGESGSPLMIAIAFILLGAILVITRRKVKYDK